MPEKRLDVLSDIIGYYTPSISKSQERRKSNRAKKEDIYQAYSIGLKLFCLKHKGEKPEEELIQEFNDLIRPYLPLL